MPEDEKPPSKKKEQEAATKSKSLIDVVTGQEEEIDAEELIRDEKVIETFNALKNGN